MEDKRKVGQAQPISDETLDEAVGGQGTEATRSNQLQSNMTKKADDTVSGQQQKIG